MGVLVPRRQNEHSLPVRVLRLYPLLLLPSASR